MNTKSQPTEPKHNLREGFSALNFEFENKLREGTKPTHSAAALASG